MCSACCALYTAYCELCMYCVLHTGYCVLISVYCVLFTVCHVASVCKHGFPPRRRKSAQGLTQDSAQVDVVHMG
jgi:hypothetical protein